MQAGNIITGKTMPLIRPKALRASGTWLHSASRLGTSRFSAVVMPERTTSAPARGRAAWSSRCRTGKEAPLLGCSRSRSQTKSTRVKQALTLLPSTTLMQERSASCPAQKSSASMVMTMEHSCSATSTRARVPIRLAAVKYPLITPLRQMAGRKAAKIFSAGMVCLFPIQHCASMGAPKYKIAATAQLHRML